MTQLNCLERVKGSCESTAQQVQKGHEDEGVCAPVMEVPDQAAERDLVLKLRMDS